MHQKLIFVWWLLGMCGVKKRILFLRGLGGFHSQAFHSNLSFWFTLAEFWFEFAGGWMNPSIWLRNSPGIAIPTWLSPGLLLLSNKNFSATQNFVSPGLGLMHLGHLPNLERHIESHLVLCIFTQLSYSSNDMCSKCQGCNHLPTVYVCVCACLFVWGFF